MSLQALLDAYAALHRMDGLPLDGNGMCRLRFRDAIDVDIEPSRREGHVHVYAVIGRAPPQAEAPYLRALLAGNLFGRETGAAAIALDPETNELVLWRLVDIEGLTAERFDEVLRDFVQSAVQAAERARDTAAGVPRAEESTLMQTITMRV